MGELAPNTAKVFKFGSKPAVLVNTVLVSAKNMTHGLDTVEISGTVAEGETGLAEVRTAGEKALKDARFRRQGLAVTTVILALFAIALALKVRRMALDRRSR